MGLTMPAFATLGRVLFAILFIVSGVFKFSDLGAMTQMVAAKIVVPADLTTYTSQLEATVGMPFAQVLVIVSGIFEIVAGLMIALNFGARFFAVLLILFIGAATFYFHDFWNMAEGERATNMFQALKNLSLIGALFLIISYPRAPATSAVTESAYDPQI
jgi:uncharacterized membrane protein YphA (DoxX/SURF4 family)